jgi:hypothetical protein
MWPAVEASQHRLCQGAWRSTAARRAEKRIRTREHRSEQPRGSGPQIGGVSADPELQFRAEERGAHAGARHGPRPTRLAVLTEARRRHVTPGVDGPSHEMK